MSHKILMFGWEFPPHNSGGLGVACAGMARALVRAGERVHFVLPRTQEVSGAEIDFCFADVEQDLFDITAVDSKIYSPYASSREYQKRLKQDGDMPSIYGNTLLAEVLRYGQKAAAIARETDHDIIHAHDWLSFPAAIAARAESGAPFVAHIHATEIDRTGGQGVNSQVYEIEKRGFEAADRILAVSEFTRQILIKHYGIDPEKIGVAYNGIDSEEKERLPGVLKQLSDRGGKLVLFLGRITLQKGPDYFLEAAKRVLEIRDDTYFIMAGSGGMQTEMIERAAELGIGDRVFFPGFVRGQKIDQLYQSADLFVMPSVSEPFGITPLEAMMNQTPVLISKQSGVSELLDHALTVDFWDTDKMADRINAVLEHPALYGALSTHGYQEVNQISWDDTAETLIAAYGDLAVAR
jgi:glycosyltransferase involved in cell wall biosynthesis